MKLLLSAATCACALLSVAHADERIITLRYDQEAVTRIDGCLGYQTMIEFAPDERIENVGLGDADQWLVVPNNRANLLFVRPALAETRSNMTVATDRRRYVFELSAARTGACARGIAPYYLRFSYADQAQSTAPPIPSENARNTAYTYDGASDNVPLRVFDDGAATYFQWAPGAESPAVYIRNADGSETLVSFVSRGEYLVIDQIAPAFVLRNGESVTILHNGAFVEPTLDALSPPPHPRAEPRRRRFWPFGRRERT